MAEGNIVALNLIAHLDDEAVEIVFHNLDKSTFSVRLEKRGIFDLKEEIDGLLRDCPEIHQWQSSLPH